MTKEKLFILLLICVGTIVLSQSDTNDRPYCFQFTWMAPMFDDKPNMYNCSLYKGVPCIEPLMRSENLPNTSELWELRNNSMMCNVTSGNVCIKYTFTYNNQIVNTSFFCGKAIVDKAEPITSGCYEQNLEGYVVETCACQPKRGREPCNASINLQHYTNLITITLLHVLIKCLL